MPSNKLSSNADKETFVSLKDESLSVKKNAEDVGKKYNTVCYCVYCISLPEKAPK